MEFKTVGKGIGLSPADRFAFVRVRGGAAVKGDTRAFDITGVDAATGDPGATPATGITPGEDDYLLANVIVPTTAVLGYGLFGVVQADVADDAIGKVLIQGIAMYVNGGAVTGVHGDDLYATNAAATLTNVAPLGGKCIAIALCDDVSNVYTQGVLFDGINGFGAVNVGS